MNALAHDELESGLGRRIRIFHTLHPSTPFRTAAAMSGEPMLPS
jgi:hypothetical protein